MHVAATPERTATVRQNAIAQRASSTLPLSATTGLPVSRGLLLAYMGSVAIAILMVIVSVFGLVFGASGLYGSDPSTASGIRISTDGIVVPGFRDHDLFNLIIALPVLLGTILLARSGSANALLMWPGALMYVVYTYADYVVG